MTSNPFATRFIRPGALPFFLVSPGGIRRAGDQELDSLVAAAIHCHFALIVGPHGSGKSTLLRTLQTRLAGQYQEVVELALVRDPTFNWLSQSMQRRRNGREVLESLNRCGTAALLVIDGMEQIPMTARIRLLLKAKAKGFHVLGTSHRSLSGFKTVFTTSVNEVLVRQLCAELLTDQSPELKTFIENELAHRHIDDVSDVRQIWFELYDRVSSLDSASLPSHVIRNRV